jgi:thiosulfate reductase cytochrome b subunit
MPGMASPGSSDTALTKTAGNGSDGTAGWPVQATDSIVRVVDTVRDKTTGPALNVARWLIYGLVLALLSLPLAVLALLCAMRLVEGGLLWLSVTYPWAAWLHDPIAFVYLLFGAVFVLAALICWRKGKKPAPA